MRLHLSRLLGGVAVAVGLILPTWIQATVSAAPVAAAVSSRCSDPQPPLISDTRVLQAPDLSEPPARAPFRDPVFGSCVVRVTDRLADIDAADASPGLKNEYSRVQSFNADESRILVRGVASTWYLYDAVTLQPLALLPFGGSVDPRWDATNPNRLYYSQETRLMSYDIGTRQTSLVHEFASDLPGQTLGAVWSKYEGSPSHDGRYWGFMAEDEQWRVVAFLVYDQQADQVIAKRDVRGTVGVDSIDNAYISPLGNYFIADFSDHYCERGQLGTDANPCGYMVYDRDLQNGRGLLRISGHMDLALDAQGREVAVFQDIDTDRISMLDLASGTVTPLWPIDFSHTAIGLHLSGRAFERPGWVVVSTHDGDIAAHTWMDDQVFLIELGGRQRLARLAHTHSLVDESREHDYWAEPQASVNRDLTRILFTSNWGRSGTEQVEMLLIDLPADWPDRIGLDWRVTEIYLATLGYAPDDEGLQYWVERIATDPAWTPTTVAQSFFDQPLVQRQYPADQGYAAFVEALYRNLFGRAPDAAGRAYWLAELTAGRVARNQMIIALIEGGWANPEAATDMARFGNRVQVGLAFAAEQAARGIRYSTLAADRQAALRSIGGEILMDVTADPASRDTAIARIPARLAALTPVAWWSPSEQDSLQIQFTDLPVDTSVAAAIYDLDLFDTAPGTVTQLQEQGRRVLCYVNAGAWEDWRSDQADFPETVLGSDYVGWPGERWLDIRRLDLLAPILRARLDECQRKGFDGVEPDNINGYRNDTGFDLTAADQLTFNRWLAAEAHARGLAIGLKNDTEQASDLAVDYDFAVLENCLAEGDWCVQAQPFIAAGKPVFAIEYTDAMTQEHFLDVACAEADRLGLSAVLKHRELDAWRLECPVGLGTVH